MDRSYIFSQNSIVKKIVLFYFKVRKICLLVIHLQKTEECLLRIDMSEIKRKILFVYELNNNNITKNIVN